LIYFTERFEYAGGNGYQEALLGGGAQDRGFDKGRGVGREVLMIV
jgi:hypothetical protein